MATEANTKTMTKTVRSFFWYSSSVAASMAMTDFGFKKRKKKRVGKRRARKEKRGFFFFQQY